MSGLSLNHHGFVTTYSMMSGSHAFEDLQFKLIFYDQRLKFHSSREAPVHQALISTISAGSYNQGGVLEIITTTITKRHEQWWSLQLKQ